MLGAGHATTIDELWDGVALKTELPTEPKEVLSAAGPRDNRGDNRRAHQRHYLRRRAILHVGVNVYGAYVQDASRGGLGVLSPVQLFPKQSVQVRIDNQRTYRLEVTRCRRLGRNCYQCGTVFVLK